MCVVLFATFILALSVSNNDAAETRIIGGSRATITAYPYLASLQTEGKHICGGVIVTANLVLCAAHCIRFAPEAYSIRVGSDFSDRGGTLVNVSDIILHPKYARRTADFDICVIILGSNLTYSRNIRPARLPDYKLPVITNAQVAVAGWGTTKIDDPDEVSAYLKRGFLRIFNTDRCKELYPPKAITNNMFCATSPVGIDACTGDSGGPMLLNGMVIGIISWGFSCADPYYPGVYTNVANVVDFVVPYTRRQNSVNKTST